MVAHYGQGVLESTDIPDMNTTVVRRNSKLKGVTKRQENAKKKMPPRWWHKPLETTES